MLNMHQTSIFIKIFTCLTSIIRFPLKKTRAVSSLSGLMTKICWTVERSSDGHLGNRVGTCKKSLIINSTHTHLVATGKGKGKAL